MVPMSYTYARFKADQLNQAVKSENIKKSASMFFKKNDAIELCSIKKEKNTIERPKTV